MSARLVFPDQQGAADVLTFASRAAQLGDGAVRLRAADGTLVITAAPLAPRDLLDPTPTVLGLRAVTIDPELVCDLVVVGSSLALAPDDPAEIVLPDSALSAMWAGISPPRGGWNLVGEVAASVLASRAQAGIADVAQTVPRDAGEEIVQSVRASVWGAPEPALGGLPLGTAFAAFALGFISGEEHAQVREAGPWRRLSLRRGHVLVRTTVRNGLTAVRSTGIST
ncbi:hypothetical protein ACFXP7_09115 [Microbacterium sp. P06]|uniref:hypothetical protein n=1 Tax=unclassified Microbacterium TaxID=2609290 RepID=UPI003745CC5C